jgi:preprotein translocase subunit SecG
MDTVLTAVLVMAVGLYVLIALVVGAVGFGCLTGALAARLFGRVNRPEERLWLTVWLLAPVWPVLAVWGIVLLLRRTT